MAIQGKTDIDQLLAKSLKEIAVRRPVEKITIKEITDKAGVIRPTFYNHFQDKFELIEWIIRTSVTVFTDVRWFIIRSVRAGRTSDPE